MTKPFLPEDRRIPDALTIWRRCVTVHTLASLSGIPMPILARQAYGDDRAVNDHVARAASSPASFGDWDSTLTAAALEPFLRSLAPRSAAMQLFTAGLVPPLDTGAIIRMPGMTTALSAAAFIEQGHPIPVVNGDLIGKSLGPPKKLALLAGLGGELERYAPRVAEALISAAVVEAVAAGLDRAVFSNTAASNAAPAGLFNGVTPITGYAGGDEKAARTDIAALVGAIADVGGGASIMLFANPRQAVTLSMLGGATLPYPIIPTPGMATGTVAAIEAGAIASAFVGPPDVDASKEAVVHFEDTTPLEIVAANGTAAAPVRSAFQTDTVILRVMMDADWITRRAGMVQWLQGATW